MKNFLKFVFKVTGKVIKDDVGAFSAQAAFFMTISFIPFTMLMLSMIRFLPISPGEVFEFTVSLFPASTKELVKTLIEEAFQKNTATFISVTAVSTLWAASIGVFAVVRGINSIYCGSMNRGYLSLRLISLLYTLFLPVIFVLCLTIFVFGSSILKSVEQSFPSAIGGALLVMSVRWSVGFVVLTAFFVLTYRFVPKRKGKLLKQIPGAVMSSAGWMLFSALFSFYYENIANYSYLYGSLSTLVFFMLWMFACFYIFFIGAEVNKCVEDGKKSRL